jgi:hypothetical protein
MQKDLTLKIGDVSIAIEGDTQKAASEIVPAYRSFIRPGKADIRLRLHRGFSKLPGLETAFKVSSPVNTTGVEPF